ncbi:MAG: TVP38/TMEM64 family protein [Ruminococcus sp.]|nr:TVP38/TMEM64 family protein [Ruminococcus sp.]
MRKKILSQNDSYNKRRKIFSAVSIIVFFLLTVLFTIFVCKWLKSFSQEGFREYINSFGIWGWLVLLGLQVLQVFIALIPGEIIESAAGFAFGPLVGTLICYLGIVIGTASIFALTRRFGVKLVEIFVPRERINELRFINTEKKRDLFVFLVFFIPGTPKDLLTYFIGLTNIKFASFLCISLISRIPSVVSSTFGGHLIGEGKYWGAILLYGITGILSFSGLCLYNYIVNRRNKLSNAKDSE